MHVYLKKENMSTGEVQTQSKDYLKVAHNIEEAMNKDGSVYGMNRLEMACQN